jgi:hypothetical protein
MTTKYYGVSSGNGNDGVSQLFPDYIVKTNDPFRLAELAIVSTYKPKYQQWAKDHADVDGEADYVIFATIYESYGTMMERNEMQDRLDAMDENDPEAAALADEIEHFGCDYAEQIIEVFAWEGDDFKDRPVFESLEDAFAESELKLVTV